MGIKLLLDFTILCYDSDANNSICGLTQVKDLEIELDSLKQSGKENLQQAVLTEKEKFTQMLWDMEELRRKCVEMELKLTSEQVYCYFLLLQNVIFFICFKR